MNSERILNNMMESDILIKLASVFGKKLSYLKMNQQSEKGLKSKPDFEHLKKVLLRETKNGPVPIVEMMSDPELMAKAMEWEDFPIDMAKAIMWSVAPLDNFKTVWAGFQFLELIITFSKTMGYDYATTWPYVPIPRTYHEADIAEKHGGKWRIWQDESKGIISDRAAFEAFPWPEPDDIGLFPIKYMANRLPEGMKVMVFQWGIFEDLKLLMGLENLAIKSIEEPQLVIDIAEKLTVLAEEALSRSCSLKRVGGVFMAEDMGFKQGTMLNPRFMREHIIPRQKRIVDVVKKFNLPFLLHSCGNIEAIMEDLINTVGIDAKHSYEDNICPVEKMFEKYHSKLAILGGLDMDLLTRGKEDDVRKRTRQILEACAPHGGYAMGSGNTLASYVPLNNYYAMIDETKKFNHNRTME